MNCNVKLGRRTTKKCAECGCILFQTRMQMKLPHDIGNDLICDECDMHVNGKYDDDSFVCVKGID